VIALALQLGGCGNNGDGINREAGVPTDEASADATRIAGDVARGKEADTAAGAASGDAGAGEGAASSDASGGDGAGRADAGAGDGAASCVLAPSAPAATGSILARIAIDPAITARRIHTDFVGLSYEASVFRAAFMATPTAPNTGLHRMLRNLGSRGTLRFGGGSQDRFCWNYTGSPVRPICENNLTRDHMDAIFGASAGTGWPVLVGLNMAVNDTRMAAAFAREGIATRTRGTLLGIEIGNEPDLYDNDNGYRANPYTVSEYARELGAHITALAGVMPSMPLVGPAVAWSWRPELGAILDAVGARRLAFSTVHFYPLTTCGNPSTTDWRYATVSNLLSRTTVDQTVTIAEAAVSAARARDQDLVFGETNSVACGGEAGVSDVFASALWSIDYLFRLAASGVRRVNFHTAGAGTAYNPIDTRGMRSATAPGGWAYTNDARPLYYGLQLFSGAQGGQLVRATVSSATANIQAHAVIGACAGCAARLFIINKDLRASGQVAVTLTRPTRRATAFMLRAPQVTASTGTTLGGQTVDRITGVLPAPATESIRPNATGTYMVSLPNASTVVLTFDPICN
jgi:hypothetical protein